jgi:hypothetical protein
MIRGCFGVSGKPMGKRSFVKLTFSQDGATSNTRLVLGRRRPLLCELECVQQAGRVRGTGLVGVWRSGSLRVTRRLTYVTGPTTQVADTVRVDYVLWNGGRRRRRVGLREMIDTLIGNNDGVPFVVPGRQGILTHSASYEDAGVPDYIQALEREDPVDPGAIVHLTLRGGDATPPDRLVIDRWPGSQAGWSFYRGAGKGWGRDSAVGLYWEPRLLAAGELWRITYFYGLGGLSSVASGNRRLSLSFPRRPGLGERFHVSARVFDPKPGEVATLEVPRGVALLGPAAQAVEVSEGASFAFLGWEAEARAAGQGPIVLQLPDGSREEQEVTVR